MKEIPGIRLLREAWERARETGEDVWQFAVEIEALYASGMSINDLRLLLRQGVLLHGEEMTEFSDSRRRFRPIASLQLTPHSCFVLTDEGYRLVAHRGVTGSRQEGDSSDGTSFGTHEESNGEPLGTLTPRWEPQLRELWFGESLVRRFGRSAPRQELILCVFEEEGWPIMIADPLPPEGHHDPKRLLQDTIRNLNRFQGAPGIRFRVAGNGESVRWESGCRFDERLQARTNCRPGDRQLSADLPTIYPFSTRRHASTR